MEYRTGQCNDMEKITCIHVLYSMSTLLLNIVDVEYRTGQCTIFTCQHVLSYMSTLLSQQCRRVIQVMSMSQACM